MHAGKSAGFVSFLKTWAAEFEHIILGQKISSQNNWKQKVSDNNFKLSHSNCSEFTFM